MKGHPIRIDEISIVKGELDRMRSTGETTYPADMPTSKRMRLHGVVKRDLIAQSEGPTVEVDELVYGFARQKPHTWILRRPRRRRRSSLEDVA
jgi:hypothetical protein